MNRNQAQGVIEFAAQQFMEADRYLLEYNLGERCIVSRYAFHLQALVTDYSVDVEYNRAGAAAKRANLPEECFNAMDEDGRALVVPDLIVHRRGLEGPNLMAIEMKKTTDPRGLDCDRLRVRAFREQLQYRYGVILVCETRRRREIGLHVVEWLGD